MNGFQKQHTQILGSALRGKWAQRVLSGAYPQLTWAICIVGQRLTPGESIKYRSGHDCQTGVAHLLLRRHLND
jgi:hypothetical protein